MLRVGLGTDIHRLEEGYPMILGGFEIPSEKGFVAHSDGDVLIHALIDALLGSLALGDVGDHFPPSDQQYKNISSVLLLEKVLQLSAFRHWHIVNIDAVINLEKPKLSSYKAKIAAHLATILGIPQEQISIKAKTAEGTDAVGQGLSASVQCIVLLESN